MKMTIEVAFAISVAITLLSLAFAAMYQINYEVAMKQNAQLKVAIQNCIDERNSRCVCFNDILLYKPAVNGTRKNNYPDNNSKIN